MAAATVLGLGRALGEAIAVTQVIGDGSAIHASLFLTGDTLASRIADDFQNTSRTLHVASLFYLALILLAIGIITSLIAQAIAHRFDVPAGCPDERDPVDPTAPLTATGNLRRRHARQPAVRGRRRSLSAWSRSRCWGSWSSTAWRAGRQRAQPVASSPRTRSGWPGGGIAPAIVGTALIVALRDR